MRPSSPHNQRQDKLEYLVSSDDSTKSKGATMKAYMGGYRHYHLGPLHISREYNRLVIKLHIGWKGAGYIAFPPEFPIMGRLRLSGRTLYLAINCKGRDYHKLYTQKWLQLGMTNNANAVPFV